MSLELHVGDARDSKIQPGTVDLVYLDPPFYTGKNHGSFDDRWESLEAYEASILSHLPWVVEALKETGNFVLHVDPRTSHYLKVGIDRDLGRENFRNEVIWNYASGGAGKKHLAKKHDVLLWWSMSDTYTFNVLREPYATPKVEDRPGFHPEGRMLTDVWNISIISTTGKERTGYPTQKPLKLLERVVELWTNPGDTVADLVCGSGTTGVAALSLGRNAILGDMNPEAIEISRNRCNLVLGRC